MRHIYTSLDIGSVSVKLLVGEIYKDKLNALFIKEQKCSGIKKGLIASAEETISVIKSLLDEAEKNLDMRINRVVVSIPYYNALYQKGEGYTRITREDKIFNGDDIVYALQASAYNRVPNDMELVSIMPLEFVIDDNKKVTDPKGIEGEKLSVTSVMGLTPKKSVYSVITLLESIGLKVVDITFNGIADYYAYKKEKYDDLTGAVINIGHEKTEVSVMHKGVLINSGVLLLGGKNIDKDIAYEYDISIKDARNLKENFASSYPNNASNTDTETLINKDGDLVSINQYEISSIVCERVKEILFEAKKQINYLTKKQISYIIITGGLTEIRDFKYSFEEVFGKNIIPNELNIMGIRNNKFSPVAGMIEYYHSKLKFRNKISDVLIDEDEEVNTRKREANVVGKIIDYFFDNN